MERIPRTPPKIEPLPPGTQRPLWSVMIPAYNCAEYLIETIESVLKQDKGIDEMQIEVIDDCSTDADIERLVLEVGKGRISYFKQPKNVGSLRNFETCINRAKGHYIHLLHGDDRVLSGFYDTLGDLFQKHPSAGAAFCAWNDIDSYGYILGTSRQDVLEDGIMPDFYDTISASQILQVVTMAVKREVYEKLGSFYAVTYGEDWEMWARIGYHYPVAYTSKVLAEYRQHNDSISGHSFSSGKNIADISTISTLINAYQPLEKREKAIKQLKSNYAIYAWSMVYQLWLHNSHVSVIYRLLGDVLKLSSQRKILYLSAKLFILVSSKPMVKLGKTAVKKILPKRFKDNSINLEHINIERDLIPFTYNEDVDYYFWWGDIPLGQSLASNALHKAKGDILCRKLLTILAPCIDSYTVDPHLKHAYKSALKEKDAYAFRNVLKIIFLTYNQSAWPAEVPISVVVYAARKADDLKRCLESLMMQKCRPQEIVVVDSDPIDESKEIVAKAFKNVLYQREFKKGVTAARNAGAKRATLSIIAFTDDDLEAHPLWTYIVWDTLSKQKVHAISGLVISSSVINGANFDSLNKNINTIRYQDYLSEKNFIIKNIHEIVELRDIRPGANMGFLRTTLEKINYFNDGPDTRMWHKILESGCIIQYNPRAILFRK